MRVFLNLSGDKDSKFTSLYHAMTGGEYSHAFLSFDVTPSNTYETYYEAFGPKILKRWPGGTRGPLKMERFYAWLEADGHDRIHAQQELFLTPAEALLAYNYLHNASGQLAYATLQIPFTLLQLRDGLAIGPAVATCTHVTCAEYVARALPPRILVPFCRLGEFTYDLFIPSGNQINSLQRGVGAYVAADLAARS